MPGGRNECPHIEMPYLYQTARPRYSQHYRQAGLRLGPHRCFLVKCQRLHPHGPHPISIESHTAQVYPSIQVLAIILQGPLLVPYKLGYLKAWLTRDCRQPSPGMFTARPAMTMRRFLLCRPYPRLMNLRKTRLSNSHSSSGSRVYLPTRVAGTAVRRTNFQCPVLLNLQSQTQIPRRGSNPPLDLILKRIQGPGLRRRKGKIFSHCNCHR